MSVRLRATAAAVVAATLSAGVVAALPATANAAAIPAPAVKLTATSEYGGIHQLVPGQHSDWPVIIKAVNSTDKPQTFRAGFGLQAKGAVNLRSGEVVTDVVAWGKTPATDSRMVAGGGIVATALFPKGHLFGEFTIPAHTTYTWKAEIAATKAWPMNDNLLKLTAGLAQDGPLREANTAPIYTHVGSATAGGTMDESLAGKQTVLTYGASAFELLTLTNHTGATLNQTWNLRPSMTGASVYATDVWVGPAATGHWQNLPVGSSFSVPADLANGASATYRIRVTMVRFVNQGLSHQSAVLTVANPDGTTNPAVVSRTFTALRSGF